MIIPEPLAGAACSCNHQSSCNCTKNQARNKCSFYATCKNYTGAKDIQYWLPSHAYVLGDQIVGPDAGKGWYR